MKISVLTPSIRPEGLKIVSKCLERQTFPHNEFEWIIASPGETDLLPNSKNIGIISGKKGFHTLNRDYNRLLKKSRGELIISWQDYIWAPPDTLEKFWYWFQEKGAKWCVTGVGDIYCSLDEFSKPIVKVWSDPRKSGRTTYGDNYECFPVDWELNFCGAPLEAFKSVGGFDEKLDFTGFGMDNVSVAERLDESGYKFLIDQNLECRGLQHSRHKDWDKHHNMHNAYNSRKLELIASGTWPKLDF